MRRTNRFPISPRSPSPAAGLSQFYAVVSFVSGGRVQEPEPSVPYFGPAPVDHAVNVGPQQDALVGDPPRRQVRSVEHLGSVTAGDGAASAVFPQQAFAEASLIRPLGRLPASPVRVVGQDGLGVVPEPETIPVLEGFDAGQFQQPFSTAAMWPRPTTR